MRTTEAIPAGTEFLGEIIFTDNPSKQLELLIRYALLAIMEIGGNRNRGCGACVVMINGENRKPGQILESLLNKNIDVDNISIEGTQESAGGDSNKKVFAKLFFEAKSPLCVPELPVVGNNAISSGFAIPASAVQGMILTKINTLNKSIADSCFVSQNFRAWPMLPDFRSRSKMSDFENTTAVPVRSPVTLKISKHEEISTGKRLFCDETIANYDSNANPNNRHSKSTNGVLISTEEGIKLWCSGDMARHISAHGVINGEAKTDSAPDAPTDNLYTVEAAAEKLYTGLVALPEDAFNLLEKCLHEDDAVQVGKARTVRGLGKLSIKKLDNTTVEKIFRPEKDTGVLTFIVQSPVLVEDDINGKPVDLILKEIVYNAGWGRVCKAFGSLQVLFGWNRHKKGLQKAQMVIAPGSVFCLDKEPDNLENLIVAGLGGGREKGYGAVLPHPGIAVEMHERIPSLVEIRSKDVSGTDESGKLGWDLWQRRDANGLRPSQIAQLQALLDCGKEHALEYLERQRTSRSTPIWDRWKSVYETVSEMIKNDTEKRAKKILKVWHDLSVYSIDIKGDR